MERMFGCLDNIPDPIIQSLYGVCINILYITIGKAKFASLVNCQVELLPLERESSVPDCGEACGF